MYIVLCVYDTILHRKFIWMVLHSDSSRMKRKIHLCSMDNVARTHNLFDRASPVCKFVAYILLQWTALKIGKILNHCVSVCVHVNQRSTHCRIRLPRKPSRLPNTVSGVHKRHATPLYERVLGLLMQTATTLHMCNITVNVNIKDQMMTMISAFCCANNWRIFRARHTNFDIKNTENIFLKRCSTRFVSGNGGSACAKEIDQCRCSFIRWQWICCNVILPNMCARALRKGILDSCRFMEYAYRQ